jgi:hypothetical protein
MSKFNKPVVTATPAPTLTTHEGAPAWQRDRRSELFLTASAGLIAENKFYEPGDATMTRVQNLVGAIACEAGPAAVGAITATGLPAHVDTGLDWLLPFITWLRRDGNMRTAPMIVAVEAVRARLYAGIQGGNRQLINAALNRADEPGELLTYWQNREYGILPKPVKRGVMDAVGRLYNEYSALKYDTGAHRVRFGDVIRACGDLGASWGKHGGVFERWLVDRSQGRGDAAKVAGETLPMVQARAALNRIPVVTRRRVLIEAADPKLPAYPLDCANHLGMNTAVSLVESGATWEWISGWLSDGGGMDAAAWEAVIPQMSFMALLRNLRNFDEAGISDEVAARVASTLSDPAQVARSKQFPSRFLSACQQELNPRWSVPLDTALTLSMSNIPELPGRTLILVDTSGSMGNPVSPKSTMTYAQCAALFGVALAHRNPGRVDLAGFATGSFPHEVKLGSSLIAEVARFIIRIGEQGHGTQTEAAVRSRYTGHDRVIIISDEQVMGGRLDWENTLTDAVPAHVPVHVFNLGGHAPASLPAARNRFTLGGLTDASFRQIAQLEAGESQRWPWQ